MQKRKTKNKITFKQRFSEMEFKEKRKQVRNALAQRIKSSRFVDNHSGWEVRRSLLKYQTMLKIDFRLLVTNMLKKHKKIRVLDIGCGAGYFLSELKNLNKTRIETHGIRTSLGGSPYLGDVEKLDKEATKKIDSLHIGSFENYKFKTKFNCIFSTIGSVYTASQAHTLQKICSLLEVGGVSAIIIPKKGVPKSMLDKMVKSGYKLKIETKQVRRRNGDIDRLRILKIRKTTNKVPNLSEFILRDLKKGIEPTVNSTISEFS